MSALSSTERRAMRANAHHLDPVVFIGQHGLTPAVQHEIDVALRAHELVKIRVHNESRVERQTMLAAICATLDCAPVQHLGKLLIVWRAHPGKAKAAVKPARERESGGRATDARQPSRDAASDRRRRRNAQRGKAGNAALPYFTRRGAGRFVAESPDVPAGSTKPDPRPPRGAKPVGPRAPRGAKPVGPGAPRSVKPFAPRAPRGAKPAERAPRGQAAHVPVLRERAPDARRPRGDSAPNPRRPREGSAADPRSPRAKSFAAAPGAKRGPRPRTAAAPASARAPRSPRRRTRS
ncbi:MAG TPA: YhbY family RNA-binding protein [Casimicrobiaceae bacterium]